MCAAAVERSQGESPEDQQSREERVQARLDVPLTIAAALVIPLIVLEETHRASPGARSPRSAIGSSGSSSPPSW